MKTLLLAVILVLTPYTIVFAQEVGFVDIYAGEIFDPEFGCSATDGIRPPTPNTWTMFDCNHRKLGDFDPAKFFDLIVYADHSLDSCSASYVSFNRAGVFFTTRDYPLESGINDPRHFIETVDVRSVFFCSANTQPAFTPEQKSIAGEKSRKYADISVSLTLAAAACAVVSTPIDPICLSLTGMAVAFERTGTRLDRIHQDPVDLNYTEPCPVVVEETENLGLGRLRRLTTRFEHVMIGRIGGSLDAAGCSADRVAGAEQEGADDWAKYQADLAQAHLNDSSPLFGRAATILQNIVAVLNQRGQDTSILDGIPESLVELEGGFAP